MEKINIYIHTNIRQVRKQTLGFIVWVLEFMTSRGEPATITNKKEVTATWKEAELIALIQALGRLNKPCELTVYCENINIISALNNGWLLKWSERDYLNSKGELIENADKWQELNDKLFHHSIMGASDRDNPYTSWMYSECGEEAEESGMQYFRARTTLEHISECIESLDVTVVEQNEDLKKLITASTEDLFEKFRFLRQGENSGFVKIENSESQIKPLYTEESENANAVITVH